jgi:hypothetical protein
LTWSLALGFWVPFGGRPASAAEECLGAAVELDAGGMGDSQEPAGEVDQVVRIRLLDSLETCEVGTEVPDEAMLLGVLSFEPVDVCSLSSELISEGFLALPAAGQISSWPYRRIAVGLLWAKLRLETPASNRGSRRRARYGSGAPPSPIALSVGAARGTEALRRARRREALATFAANLPAHVGSSLRALVTT